MFFSIRVGFQSGSNPGMAVQKVVDFAFLGPVVWPVRGYTLVYFVSRFGADTDSRNFGFSTDKRDHWVFVPKSSLWIFLVAPAFQLQWTNAYTVVLFL